MKLALIAMLPLLISAPSEAAQRARTAKPVPSVTGTITVTDLSGAPLSDVRVNLIGGLDRSGSTQPDGTVRFDGLRPGTYRLRFSKEGYTLFERELEVRAGQAPPNISVALTPAPEPPPPPEPEPIKEPLPPPGEVVTVSVPNFIERNLIAGTQPQKVTQVSCSGLVETLLWQVREPWEDRTHEGADLTLYVVGGEGTLRIGGREVPLAAGSFAQVPRGSSYSLARRGRNPIFILATLAGEACQ